MDAHAVNSRVSIKHDLVLVVDIVELLLGNVDSSFGQEVDLSVRSARSLLGRDSWLGGVFDLPCPLVAFRRTSRLAH